ncbi:MAG: amino acid adenylation domain-containing protein, partial [bacterium]|nr:amino acid adenylation domain-containing protein [bacterium]
VVNALYGVLLSRLARREEIVVGVPTAGRGHAHLEQVIGMFVNTLPLRSNPGGDRTFETYLRETGKETLLAFENQALPFEEMVGQLNVERELSRNPLFDVMFTLDNIEHAGAEIPGLRLTPYKRENRDAKFDLTLIATEKGEKIQLEYEYCTALFKEETVRRFDTVFQRIIGAVLENPGIRLEQIDIAADEEKQRILYEFNEPPVEYPKHKTIHGLVEEQALKRPDRLAVSSIPQRNGGETGELTFRGLNEKARALAVLLRQKGIGPGRIVGIMVTPSLEMTVGILAVLKAGGAWLPISPGYTVERTAYMMGDSNAALMLTQAGTKEKAGQIATKVKEITKQNAPGIILIDGHFKSKNKDTQKMLPSTGTSNPAYIIYTSGSTGKPKGVVVPHSAFVNRLYSLKRRFRFDEGDVILQKAANTFDVSVCELFRGLVWGARLVVAGTEVNKDMEELVRIIETYKVTVIEFVPIVLNLFLEHIKNHGEIGRVSRLRQAFVGGEAVDSETVKLFHRRMYEPCGTRLVNAYGPTEAAVDVAWYDCTAAKAGEVPPKIPIGKPIDNTRLLILDRALQLVPTGVPGELCVAGDSLASGYLNRPELTTETFIKNRNSWSAAPSFPNNQSPITDNQSFSNNQSSITDNRLYRTGDLARWQPDGNIEFMGRIDRQLKIRGFRIEPGEIENRLMQQKNVKEAVVIAREYKTQKEDKYLCAYIVTEGGTRSSGAAGDSGAFALSKELEKNLSMELPGYMVPSYYIRLEAVPLTANGKVDVKALPEPAQEIVGEQYTAPRNAAEKKLAAMWAQVLERDESRIGIDDNFFYMGGHSLKAAQLIAGIHKAMGVTVQYPELFAGPTIRALAASIETAAKETGPAIKAEEKKEYYPLSSAQKRMHLQQQMESAGTGYNMPLTVLLEGTPDRKRLENTLGKLIARHESLRTSFQEKDGENVQVIHEPREIEFCVQYEDKPGDKNPGKSDEAFFEGFICPFDLTRAPLMRVALRKREKNAGGTPTYMLILDMHHIISDGVSFEIFIGEFMELYAGKELRPLALQYRDYSEWQNRAKETDRVKKQETYWLKQFEGNVPEMRLPTDYPRPVRRSFVGKTLIFGIEKGETAALKNTALRQGATIYMVLSAIFNSFLSRLSGQEDIVIGTPAAGRGHAGLEGTIGMFVNTLAMRNRLRAEQTYGEFLNNVKETTLEAFENQDYQFEELVGKLDISRDASRSPLFDVMFQMQNMETTEIEIPG